MFNSASGSSGTSEPRLSAMTAIPDIESDNGLYWYFQMICEIAAKGNRELRNKYFYEVDYIEVYEEYVLKLAAKLDGNY